MYYGTKKKIIITIIVIVLIITIFVVGGYLFVYTDMFKSSQELFYKYMGQTLENLKYTENLQLSDINKLKMQTPYKENTNITIDYGKNDDLLINIESITDKTKDRSYSNITGKYKNQDIFKMEYANSNNISAIKWEEIVQMYYVGIRNNNLKDLAEKLDLQNANIIPKSINKVNINDLITITEQEKQNLEDNYYNILLENISKDSYIKQPDMPIVKNGVTYNTTAYRLDLTAMEVKNIIINMLENLKQDSITLNLITIKAKTLGLDEQYTNVNMLNNTISDLISKINSNQIKIDKDISITIYVDSGKVILTEILIKNESKISIYVDKDTSNINIHFKIENMGSNENYNYIDINLLKQITTMESNIQLSIDKDGTDTIDVILNNVGSATEKRLTSNYEVVYSNETNSIKITGKTDIEFLNNVEDIINLDNTNCATLNDYTKEQLVPFWEALIERIKYVVNQKFEILGIEQRI